MNTQPTTTYQSAIKSIEVVYHVADRRGDKSVTVTASGGYSCNCDAFALYGDCKHSDTVRAQRKAEGRKF